MRQIGLELGLDDPATLAEPAEILRMLLGLLGAEPPIKSPSEGARRSSRGSSRGSSANISANISAPSRLGAELAQNMLSSLHERGHAVHKACAYLDDERDGWCAGDIRRDAPRDTPRHTLPQRPPLVLNHTHDARRRRLTEADFESALGIALAADDGGEFKSQVRELVLALKQSDLVDAKHDPPRVAYHGFISALYVVDTAAPEAAETAAEAARAANGRAAEVRDGIEEAARGLIDV